MLDTQTLTANPSPPFQAQGDIPKMPYRQNYRNLHVSAPPAMQIEKNLYVGPGTAKIIGNDPDSFYTPEQIRALHQQAELTDSYHRKAAKYPLVILTPEDRNYLTNPDNEKQSIKEIRSWLPKSYNDLTNRDLHDTYKYITHSDRNFNEVTSDIYNEKKDKWQPHGAVVVIPGPAHSEKFYRGFTGVGFQEGLMDKQLQKEMALAVAAHEVSHAKGERVGNSHESYADSGSYEFVRNHPQWFPKLANEDGTDNYSTVVLGGRAIATYQYIKFEEHMRPSFCSPRTGYCFPETENSSFGAKQIKADVQNRVKQYERAHNLQTNQDLPPTDQSENVPPANEHYTNPAHPQFARDMEVLRLLSDRGEFYKSSGAERDYVENVLAGADYYLNKNALQSARAEVNKTKAPIPRSKIIAQLQ